MSYIKKTLIPGEEIKVVAKKHIFVYRWVIFWLLLTVIFLANDTPLFILTGIFAFWAWLKTATTEMVCTNKRIVCREGILFVNVNEIRNAKVESIELKYSIWGNIFGFATLHASGTGTSHVLFKNIKKPWKIKAEIEKVINE